MNLIFVVLIFLQVTSVQCNASLERGQMPFSSFNSYFFLEIFKTDFDFQLNFLLLIHKFIFE